MSSSSSRRLSHKKSGSWPMPPGKPARFLTGKGSGWPPQQCWRRKLNSHANSLKEFSVTFMEALKMFGLGLRLWNFVQRERSLGRVPPIDPFNRVVQAQACHGVPCGGMGGGSMSRGWRGDFRRWQFIPGICEESPVMADQFSVFIKRNKGQTNEKTFSSVLYPGRPPEMKKGKDDEGLSSWEWKLDGQRSTYHALFPRAWTVYDGEPDPELVIMCTQVSPFLPHNYKESSLPTCAFAYMLNNTGKDDAEITLMFTFENSIGSNETVSRGGHYNEAFEQPDGVKGVLLHHSNFELYKGNNDGKGSNCSMNCRSPKGVRGGIPVTFAIAALEHNGVQVSLKPCFSILGESRNPTAKAMWSEIKQEGRFKDTSPGRSAQPSYEGECIGAAVAATVTVPANSSREIVFSLSWDAPIVKFSKGSTYYRRYTQFYGHDGKAAPKLAHDTLLRFKDWSDEIEKWQNPVLLNETLPEWYRITLFNELYYLVAGGTVWTDGGPRLQERTAEEVGPLSRWVGPVETEDSTISDDSSTEHSGTLANSTGTTFQGIVSTIAGLVTPAAEVTQPYEKAVGDAISPESATAAGSAAMTPDNLDFHLSEEEGRSRRINGASLVTSLSMTGLAEKVPSGQLEALDLAKPPSKKGSKKHGFGQSPWRRHESKQMVSPDKDFAKVSKKPSRSSKREKLRIRGSKARSLDDTLAESATWRNSSGVSLLSSGEENVGQFLYLEGVEYIMWNTYDVHFYASFALLALFPKIELSIQRDFAVACLTELKGLTRYLANGHLGKSKVMGSIPHDLGNAEPWIEPNAYNIHDTSQWKDLNCKFVLQVYRDVVATGDMKFAKATWPAVHAAMLYMERFDKDDDGLIENDGFPDQTYDAWSVHGVSAYCGGLWLTALQAAKAMAELMRDADVAKYFNDLLQKGRESYLKKLWNGRYFNYDSGTSSNSNSIQADQLAGQWYGWSSGLPPLFDDSMARSCLKMIFDNNVMKVHGGRMGAVNGMHPNGKVDETCMQSREVWTGVTYAVAAAMLYEGMSKEAFTTAEGIFQAGWCDHGYWFQTPEAWTTTGRFRSLTYMRPLAIWAMQWALSPPPRIALAASKSSQSLLV